ncbi:hypothetical protein [Streptacidiphilus sp. PAMC 29251]
MSGIPQTLVLSEEEMAAIADAAVADLARRLADRAFRPLHDGASDGGGAESVVDGRSVVDGETVVDGEALARLHALVHLQRAVERQKDRAAEHAVRAGAGYPQLGHACAMSRQGARRRWPGLVTLGSVPAGAATGATAGAPLSPTTAAPTAHHSSIDRSH